MAVCREGLVTLADAGIPFYFIYGNHERQAGRRVMERFTDDGLAVHLGFRYEMINGAVALYGIDHRSDWSGFVPDFEQFPADVPSMLCVHQALDPFTASSNPVASLADLRTLSRYHWTVVVTGHTHTRRTHEYDGMQGLSGGATTRVGESGDELLPSTELISIRDDGVNTSRPIL